MKKAAGLVLLFFLFALFAHAQLPVMNCVVKDLYFAQSIPFASIVVDERDTIYANDKGEWNLSLQQNQSVTVKVSAKGYGPKTVVVKFTPAQFTIFLEPLNYQTNYIQVRGLYNGKNLFNTPGSIANLVTRDLQRNNQVELQQSFNVLPGVRMEFRNINTGARIILRGYGNQNNNNGIGYKAYYNDIPLTEADGTTNLDDIDFATLARVEVFRGPVSSVYGTGIGGVVNFVSEKAPQGISVRQWFLTGSNNTFRTTSSVGVGNDKSNIIFNYGQQRTDGYRMNSASKKDFWNLNASFYNSAKSTLSAFVYYTKSNDQLSGQVDSFGLINYPDSAEISYLRNNSHSELESIRMGVSQEYSFNKLLSNKTTFFVGTQEIGQGVATILTKTHKSSFGARTAFIFTPTLGPTVTSRFTLGMEVHKNIIYQKSYNLNNGVLGTLRTDQELKPLQWNVFGMLELTIAKNTLMVFSGSANFITYDNEDLRATAGSYINQSGYRTFKPLVTPRWVVNHLVSKNISVYSNYSMGYAQPGTAQFIIPQTGKVNEGIKPEISNTFEVGTKASLFKDAMYLNFAFFNMDVTDKIVTQNFPAAGGNPAYIAFVNAGSVNFTGAELTINYALIPKQKQFLGLLRPFMSYTYNGSRNSDLKSDNNNNSSTRNYSNLHVSGLARNILNVGFDVEAGDGFYLNATDLFTDRIPITLDNTVYADSYNLVNLKAGYRKEFGKTGRSHFSFDVFGGNNNIFNATYAQFVVINLVPVGGVAPKYFTPGPRSTLYAGLSLRYTFR
ncbi:TonB-dependent receptor [Sediminibacterium roseum]|uniref:TonB-dependent receptor n=1 Tax=Sediminibacterium roseum TaxID=1978412 RepID=A0ABW9ZVK8_9BACT|nr:TonB-dependent receptor plug domain-containing protein [Sediminibacterium roseum]NCI51213.1 TonB-dependent receptor [Sediminibacterium roseum]